MVLDHAPRPGGAWQFRWPTLTYGRVHGMHALPGMELTGADETRPSSEVIGAYFRAYEERFGLRVRRPVDVRAVREGEGGRLLVETSDGVWAPRALISATGTWDRPFWPRYPGQEEFRGRQLHTAGYPGPDAFAGQRVLVVGGGTSAVQHLLEIAPVAAPPPGRPAGRRSSTTAPSTRTRAGRRWHGSTSGSGRGCRRAASSR